MNRRFLLLFVWWIFALGFVSPVVAQWQAAVTSVNITPTTPMWMAGYAGRDRPAESKLTDLWMKVLVLQDADQKQAVLITMDLIGIDRGLSNAITHELQKKYGLERHQIALNTSHTHTGPVVAKNLRPMHYVLLNENQKKLIDDYARFLRDKAVSAVGEARKRLKPATVRWGVGEATFGVNRRNNPERDVPQLRAEKKLKGPVDHDVPVLAVFRPGQPQPHAVVFGYACHATVLSFYQWSGDYPGFAQIELEKKLPGCTALFWAGCGGDINPLPRRRVELAQDYGRQLANAVQKVVNDSMQDAVPRLQTSYREIDLPLGKLPDKEALVADSKSTNRFVKARAKVLLEQLETNGELKGTYPYPIGIWQIGDQVQQVFLGGEVVVDYALRLKAELGGKQTWVAGYSNDVMAYIPSRRVLREGGYEGASAMVYYGLPTKWSPELENLIVRAVRAQLK